MISAVENDCLKLDEIITELERDIASIEKGEQDKSLTQLIGSGPLDGLKSCTVHHLAVCTKLGVVFPNAEQFFKGM